MGLAKALLHKLPIMNNYSNDIIFSIGAIFVVICGLIVPILLYELFIKRNNSARFVFGLKPIVK
jgi:Na+(H+)/acetate symporter ActP